MTIKCLSSVPILERNDKLSKLTIERFPEANYFGIRRRNFVQYKVNPTPNERMIELQEEVSKIEIIAQGSIGTVIYTANLLDNLGNILNTYKR